MTQFETSYVGTEANQFRILDQLLTKVNAWGLSLLVGDWGARIDDANLTEYQRQMLDVFRQRKLSWAWFAPPQAAPSESSTAAARRPRRHLQIAADLGTPYR